MERNLIIHIGLMKTGTTFIQNEVLADCTNAITPYSKELWKGRLLTSFVRSVYQRNSITKWKYREDSLIKNIELVWNEYLKNESTLILSNEALTNPPFLNIPRWVGDYSGDALPITKQLASLVQSASKSGITIKVLLTLRNQAAWMASLYAQRSQKRPTASQQDFEECIKELLKDHSLKGIGYLDWSRWVHELEKTLGTANLCVLLLEEMRTPGYWKRINDFLNLKENPDYLLAKSKQKKKNVRSVDNARSWKLRHRSLLSSNLYNLLIQKMTFSELIEKFLIVFALKYDSYINSTELMEDQIYLTKNLEEVILKSCSSYNRRLSIQLQKDLTDLGY